MKKSTMVKNIQHLLDLIKRILRSSKFVNPPKVPILLFDAASSESLEKLVLYDLDFMVVHTRGTNYIISFSIIYRFLINYMKHPRDVAYLGAIIAVVSPKVVITYTDNSSKFHYLSKNFLGPVYYTIQNGSRDLRDVMDRPLKDDEPIYMKNFWCFGQYEKDMYESVGHTIDKYYKNGSLRLSFFKNEILPYEPAPPSLQYDICLISNYKKEICEPDKYPSGQEELHVHGYTKQSMDLMHSFIGRYVQEKKLKIAIAGTRQNAKESAIEEKYFKSLFGPAIEFIPNNRIKWTTFKTILQSKLSICYNSTAGFETIGLGKKSLFCNFTKLSDLDPPWPGIWSFTKPDYASFQIHVDKYLAMPENEFTALSTPFSKYLFGDFQKFDGHTTLRQAILKDLQFTGSHSNTLS